MNQLILINVL